MRGTPTSSALFSKPRRCIHGELGVYQRALGHHAGVIDAQDKQRHKQEREREGKREIQAAREATSFNEGESMKCETTRSSWMGNRGFSPNCRN